MVHEMDLELYNHTRELEYALHFFVTIDISDVSLVTAAFKLSFTVFPTPESKSTEAH